MDGLIQQAVLQPPQPMLDAAVSQHIRACTRLECISAVFAAQAHVQFSPGGERRGSGTGPADGHVQAAGAATHPRVGHTESRSGGNPDGTTCVGGKAYFRLAQCPRSDGSGGAARGGCTCWLPHTELMATKLPNRASGFQVHLQPACNANAGDAVPSFTPGDGETRKRISCIILPFRQRWTMSIPCH